MDELRTGRRAATSEVIDTLLAGTDRLGVGISRALDGGEPQAPAGTPRTRETTPSRPANGHRPAGTGTRTGPDAGSGDAGQDAGTGTRTGRDAGAGDAGQSLVPAAAAAGGVVMVPTERLDELARMIGESASAHLRVGRMLKDRFGVDPASCAEFNEPSRSLNGLQDRAMRSRMVPVARITDKLQRAVRDLARRQGKTIRWGTPCSSAPK